MPLFPWIREDIKKYSFIKNIEFKNAVLILYYEKNGVTLKKKIPYRSDKDKLIKTIEAIKEEIDYKEDREKRIKNGQYSVNKEDLAFGFSSEAKND